MPRSTVSDVPAVNAAYRPERIWLARQRYFHEGENPAELLNETLLRSWERCRQAGLAPQEHAAFDPVERSHLSLLLEQERALIEAAKPALDELAAAVSDAGYAVLLTDARGRVLAVAGDLKQRSQQMRKAFRPGIDASEAVIGTSAMTMAMAEGKPVTVLGAEHYLSDNQVLHCCAAPVFDPQGRLLGSVDVTRDVPHVMPGVMSLTSACAARIEQQLFWLAPAFLRVGLAGHAGALLAFDRDGQVLAASSAARRLMDLPQQGGRFMFEDLFEGRFDAWASGASKASRSGHGDASLLLHGGIRLAVQSLDMPSGEWAVGGARLPTADSTSVRHLRSQGGAARSTQEGFVLPDDVCFRRDFQAALRAFEAGLPVMVTGPTGAGKEVAARGLHAGSSRSGAPFQAINCGAISPELVASELFGHVEGAYTGAARGGNAGKVVAANGGTVLLDEIGDMPLSLQVALLRVLDSGEVLPVGATRPTVVDVRFVCATHRDLRKLVAEGRFREDLYFRLGGCQLRVPWLRDRSDFDGVLDRLCLQLGVDGHRIGLALRAQLRRLPWPGNVRQLQHAVRLAFALAAPGAALTLEDFRVESGQWPVIGGAEFTTPGRCGPDRAGDESTPALDLVAHQRRQIGEALVRCGGNVTAAAQMLGIGRATLYRRIKADPSLNAAVASTVASGHVS